MTAGHQPKSDFNLARMWTQNSNLFVLNSKWMLIVQTKTTYVPNWVTPVNSSGDKHTNFFLHSPNICSTLVCTILTRIMIAHYFRSSVFFFKNLYTSVVFDLVVFFIVLYDVTIAINTINRHAGRTWVTHKGTRHANVSVNYNSRLKSFFDRLIRSISPSIIFSITTWSFSLKKHD